jgi:hypothetical protein
MQADSREFGVAMIVLAVLGTCRATFADSKADAQIETIASTSACSKYYWKDRGYGKPGYFKGIAHEYAKAACSLQNNPASIAGATAMPTINVKEDALALYGKADGSAFDRLRATYTLAIGEGMRESSGNPTEGFDGSLPPQTRTSANAEAGLFQQSYDSIGESPWLARLFRKYAKDTSTCRLDLFMEGYSDKKIPVVGSGEGARFQALTKSCPAFATEYAALMFRVNRTHFGPIERQEAELHPACEAMLAEVEKVSLSTCAKGPAGTKHASK